MTTKKVLDFLHEKESYEIRGACFAVYNALGGGIQEKIIERALFKELTDRKLSAQKQARVDVFYNDAKIGVYVPDLVVNEKIMVEIKSKPFVTKEDEKQFWGYLKGSSYQLGFLVNFGTRNLEIKRFAHTIKPVVSA